ncbi:MAG TPA: hypothetical protein VGO57_16420 [Verrucomicrobiae bacterium]
MFDHFKLTLEAGERTEAVGPLFYSEQKPQESTLAFPPFYSDYQSPSLETREYDVLYPLFSYEYYGAEWRWQLGELFSFAGGKQADEFHTHRFTLFPVYFQQRSLDTNLNYTAVFPFYGHLQGRLFRDKMFFVMFPIYGQTQKKDIVTDNYFYPIGHIRNGNGLHGWQVWPFAGSEHKDINSITNGFGDVSLSPGHDNSFIMWPFWFDQNNDLGTTNPVTMRASIPFFAKIRSSLRDQTSVIWPLFAWVDDRGLQYHEWEGPWPFVIFARGEGKHTSRVWPIFSESRKNEQKDGQPVWQESDSYAWPLYRYKHYHLPPFDQERTSVVFYLFVNVAEKNTDTGEHKGWNELWPLYHWRRDFNGNERLQILAPLEVVLPTNRGILRNWTPLWSLWVSEKNPTTGADSQSLLWNLYHREAAPAHKKISLLFGLFQYQRDGENHRTRLFYLTISRTQPATK